MEQHLAACTFWLAWTPVALTHINHAVAIPNHGSRPRGLPTFGLNVTDHLCMLQQHVLTAEPAALKVQVQELLRDNGILKRAVQIQAARMQVGVPLISMQKSI